MLVSRLVSGLDDDLSGDAEVAVKPGSPQAATVRLNVHLLVAELVVDLGMWRQLKHR